MPPIFFALLAALTIWPTPAAAQSTPQVTVVTLGAGSHPVDALKRMQARAAMFGELVTMDQVLARVKGSEPRDAIFLCTDPRVRVVRRNTRCYLMNRRQLNAVMRTGRN